MERRRVENDVRGWRLAASAAVCVFCTLGCDVGPKYAPAKIVVPVGFKESAATTYATLPPGTWRAANPRDAALKGRWWEIFHEPELDALEAQLVINNQTVAQYIENFMAARAQVNVARAGYFPTVTASPSITHTSAGTASAGAAAGATTAGTAAGASSTAMGMGTNGATSGSSPTAAGSYGSGTFFVLPLEASWAPDLWGRVRNTVKEYRYAAQVSAADLANLRLTEEATLAQLYFQLRGQDALYALYKQTIQQDKDSLEYTMAQHDVGTGTEEAVAQADVTLQNAEATAIGLATNRSIYEHAIATLIGQPASAFALPYKSLGTAVPPIPVAIPSDVLERRPDVAAAERACAQANALIGVEKAAYYPSLNLAASAGLASNSLSTLFSAPAFFWSLGASVAQTVFDGGLRKATVEQYTALYRANVAAYRQTVLTAFQQVEDYVATLRIVSQQIARQESAVRAAQHYVDIATAGYQIGTSPYLDVITAQTLLLSGQQTLETLRVSELVASVQLIQALGGGWDVRELPREDKITSKEGIRQATAPP